MKNETELQLVEGTWEKYKSKDKMAADSICNKCKEEDATEDRIKKLRRKNEGVKKAADTCNSNKFVRTLPPP